MDKDEYDKVELPALEQLQQLGWHFLPGAALAPLKAPAPSPAGAFSDEAHRAQYGSLGVAINTGLPNAPKIAFTGTPLITSEKTSNEFGGYIDTYTIEQAVADGATCQILYEGRAAATKVTGDSLDKLFDEYFGDRTAEEKQAIKKKFGTEQAVFEAPQRIRWVCIDLLKHYREHIQPNGFKAMIVTSSRRAAVTYKKILDELDGPDSEVIISGNHNDHKLFTTIIPKSFGRRLNRLCPIMPSAKNG
ncbi:MAG: type I restriction enzyme R subunit [Cellvibrionaceae bacterium]|jgi:type I restriction enzyme R subunit